MRPLVYIAHQLGNGPNRDENLREATRWCAWAADHGVLPIAPWIAIATHWPETRRDEGLALDLEVVEQCQGVWLCGSRVSTGMRQEAEHAYRLEKPVWRMTEMWQTKTEFWRHPTRWAP